MKISAYNHYVYKTLLVSDKHPETLEYRIHGFCKQQCKLLLQKLMPNNEFPENDLTELSS